MKQVLALLVGLVVILVAAWVLLFNSTPKSANNNLNQDQSFTNQESGQIDKFTKADKGQGGVWTQVTLITAKNRQKVQNQPANFNANNEIAFYVALNTHTVDLSAYQLDKMAILSPSSGQKVKPLRWESEGAGHHVSGFLIFNRYVDKIDILKTSKLKLSLGKVAKSERKFSWRLK